MTNYTFSRWLHLVSRGRSRKRGRAVSPRRMQCYRPTLDMLEDRRLMSVSAPGEEMALVASSLDVAPAAVIDRHVFYNNSRFDHNDPTPGPTDDGAIAVDKQALLPGQSATFANYTSFVSGINGLMVDIHGLAGAPVLSDFEFRVGNNDSSDTWTSAPAPIDFDVRVGAGVEGSTRITVTWADGTIKNEWLQVVVRATANTGLAQSDVFYFGNAVGESGDHTTDALTDATDQVGARSNPRGLADPAPITSVYDMNRDGLVNASDEIIARTAYNGQGGLLWLITPDSSAGQRLAQTQSVAAAPALSESAASTPAFVDLVRADVVGRWVFYNNSQFDGSNSAANASDDGAIAIDKAALLPGESAAVENYTNYSRGLNGIMIDVAGLPGTPTAEDFEFRAGPAGDPNSWVVPPKPSAITIRRGAGVDGSDRVTITWPDGYIKNGWLQVTVKATPRTGLQSPDVFYFGNLIGDSGDTPAFAIVDATDRIATRNSTYSFENPAPITAAADYDRDSLINSADEWIAINSEGLPEFRMITAPAADATLDAALPPADFVHWGDARFRSTFAPTLVTTTDGSILYFAEGRAATVVDPSSYAIVMRRSTDNGASWSPLQTLYSEIPYTVSIGSPTAVVDEQSGEIFLLFNKDKRLVFIMSSTDDGLTWSSPREITADVKVTAQGNPNPDAFPDAPWGWNAVGSGHGIQLQNGPHAGRLLITADHRLTDNLSDKSWAHVIYSDDHGQTWHLGGGLDQTNPINDRTNENTIAEGSDGSIYMSIRLNDKGMRGGSRSYDGGMTWTNMQVETDLQIAPVHASLLRINENTVLLSAPDSRDGTRQAMTIWVSHDNMHTWQKTKTVFYGYAAYSDMVLAGPDTVLLVFAGGRDNFGSNEHMYLTRFNLRWLESPDDYEFTWHFSEREAGQSTDLGGSSIIDSSKWDNRGVPLADSSAEAPQYVDGPDGHTALRLTSGSDRVMLTPAKTRALQFEADESFTIEFVMRTTDSTGMIAGVSDNAAGWSLKLLDGRVQFIISDTEQVSTVTSSAPINDGNWHRISARRNAATHELDLIIDGALSSSGTDATRLTLWSDLPVMLGADSGGAQQLAFDIDVLRVARRALYGEERLPANLAEPPRYPATTYASDAPNAIDGLEFWLPSYDPTRFYADRNFADAMPEDPTVGTAAHSAIDVSSNEYRAQQLSEYRHALYVEDPVVGPSWLYDSHGEPSGYAWNVLDSNGASANNFDFVQNTGEFTISTFIKPGQNVNSAMMLFDNRGVSTTDNGFSLRLRGDGALALSIVGEDFTTRVEDSSAPGLISADVWYHLAVVGHGPGQPITYYVTPVSNSVVEGFQFGAAMTGPNTISPSVNNLHIGSSADLRYGYKGQMVDQAIYNRALTAVEIQMLFDYTKKN